MRAHRGGSAARWNPSRRAASCVRGIRRGRGAPREEWGSREPRGARGFAGRKEGGGGRGSGWGGVECAERTKSPTAGDVADLGRRATGRYNSGNQELSGGIWRDRGSVVGSGCWAEC